MKISIARPRVLRPDGVMLRLFAVLLAALPPLALAAGPAECAPQDGLKPICGLHQPGDLEALPDGRHLLVTQMNMGNTTFGVSWKPGQLTRVDGASGERVPAYPRPGALVRSNPRKGWGDPACPEEIGSALSPGGLHLSRRNDGVWQVLVVNHGVRESVEFFELGRDGLQWRGCVVAPPTSLLGDVAALPGGAFAATNMIDGHRLDLVARIGAVVARGEDTGFVLTWAPGAGWKQIPGSGGTLPKGIQSDSDGRHVYYSVGGLRAEVRKVVVATGAQVATAPGLQAERLSWDGRRLLATGFEGPYRADVCGKVAGHCPAPFHVTALDSSTLATTRLFRQDGTALEGATVAVPQGKRWFLGSFISRHILSIPRP
ncbi:hypothetical protein [Denitratisoma oestradiolicum]|uniref:Uncharacterized protein n=1 Tax=Denitratisoma oestradiolicum TaxID=311182 RepID=A0A6S6Y603_9PROT|nr:hypothetical protein [Denitratisoma oestradiolicum]CAB1370997.1 conserved exported protein of unknown function [Denitratisoma oestradiolicum]